MPYRFVRTAAGQAEIRSGALNLPRPVRNLLLILSPAQPARHWLALVNGCSQADLNHLVAEGLVARAESPSARTTASADADFLALQQRVRKAAYGPLYATLNLCGKDMLGLLRGYRFALEVERCGGAVELQAMALRFLDQVQAEHGPTGLKRFGELLPPA